MPINTPIPYHDDCFVLHFLQCSCSMKESLQARMDRRNDCRTSSQHIWTDEHCSKILNRIVYNTDFVRPAERLVQSRPPHFPPRR